DLPGPGSTRQSAGARWARKGRTPAGAGPRYSRCWARRWSRPTLRDHRVCAARRPGGAWAPRAPLAGTVPTTHPAPGVQPSTRGQVTENPNEMSSKKDVLRCLKRFIVREVFRDLRTDLGLT